LSSPDPRHSLDTRSVVRIKEEAKKHAIMILVKWLTRCLGYAEYLRNLSRDDIAEDGKQRAYYTGATPRSIAKLRENIESYGKILIIRLLYTYLLCTWTEVF
jgi:hypothetical protein